jgi:hypothetical protein
MRPKVLVAAGLVLAFLVGAMANGIYSTSTRAFNPATEVDERFVPTVQSQSRQPAPSVSRMNLVQPRTVYADAPAVVARPAPARVYEEAPKKRSLGKEILIVGGSAGAGAAVGAVAGGKKGAAIGAISGGVAGLIYDIATRNK